jgi:hypothetical protein
LITGRVVIHLADFGTHLHQLLVGLDASQGIGLFVGIGADVVSLAGAVDLRMSEVEIAGLAVAVFASVGGGQDGPEPSSSLSSKVCGTGK